MKIRISIAVSAVLLAATTFSSTALADKTIRCESKNHQYKECRIDTHGYVRLQKQTSRSKCIQGRTWDYDRRGIWVDDNCAADFVVESRNHSSSDENNSGNTLAAVAAVALIAAVASSASKNKKNLRNRCTTSSADTASCRLGDI